VRSQLASIENSPGAKNRHASKKEHNGVEEEGEEEREKEPHQTGIFAFLQTVPTCPPYVEEPVEIAKGMKAEEINPRNLPSAAEGWYWEVLRDNNRHRLLALGMAENGTLWWAVESGSGAQARHSCSGTNMAYSTARGKGNNAAGISTRSYGLRNNG